MPGTQPTREIHSRWLLVTERRPDWVKGVNVCFCYVDMDWWNSLFNPFDSPATVGINSATPFNNNFQYVQVGRFGEGVCV
jgi:hypothetical protein